MLGSSRKISTSAPLTMLKFLILWITTNCGKFLNRWKYQTTLPISWETCMLVKKQQLELNMEQQTGSKQGKKYVKTVYCHPTYLTFMKSTSWWNSRLDESQTGIKTARRNINLRYADNITLIAESEEELKKPLNEGQRRKWKSWLESQHSKN